MRKKMGTPASIAATATAQPEIAEALCQNGCLDASDIPGPVTSLNCGAIHCRPLETQHEVPQKVRFCRRDGCKRGLDHLACFHGSRSNPELVKATESRGRFAHIRLALVCSALSHQELAPAGSSPPSGFDWLGIHCKELSDDHRRTANPRGRAFDQPHAGAAPIGCHR